MRPSARPACCRFTAWTLPSSRWYRTSTAQEGRSVWALSPSPCLPIEPWINSSGCHISSLYDPLLSYASVNTLYVCFLKFGSKTRCFLVFSGIRSLYPLQGDSWFCTHQTTPRM